MALLFLWIHHRHGGGWGGGGGMLHGQQPAPHITLPRLTSIQSPNNQNVLPWLNLIDGGHSTIVRCDEIQDQELEDIVVNVNLSAVSVMLKYKRDWSCKTKLHQTDANRKFILFKASYRSLHLYLELCPLHSVNIGLFQKILNQYGDFVKILEAASVVIDALSSMKR